jgi:hypothetical protein
MDDTSILKNDRINTSVKFSVKKLTVRHVSTSDTILKKKKKKKL